MERFDWEKTKEGTIRLLSVKDMPSEVIVPERIEGLPVTEVGPYCFAGNKYLERVVLPDTVTCLARMVFYHCVSLKELEIGAGLIEIGSDCFMNCHNFHSLVVRCGAKEKSGVRLILHQISHDLLVHFKDKDEAKLLFTEYYETYDEVTPAHLFGRNIEGEGFRTRLFFKEGIFEYNRYDSTFRKACTEEREETLCEIAMNRLWYPVDLLEEAKRQYSDYVKAHIDIICRRAVLGRDCDRLEFLCEKQLMTMVALEQAACLAAEHEWAEGGALLLRLKARYFTEKVKKSRYEFDDF